MAEQQFPYLEELKSTMNKLEQMDRVIDKNTQPTDHPPMTDLTRQEMTASLAQNKAEVNERLANFDASISKGFSDLRVDMSKIQTEMHKNTADLIKWAIGLALAIIGATVGLLTYINKSTEKPAPPQPAPIVIYAQPAPAPQVPAGIPQPAK